MQLISPDYQALNRQLHGTAKSYGAGSYRWSERVEQLRDECGAQTVLDYGSGKGTLAQALGHPGWLSEYDPAVPGKDQRPTPADLVVCTDVLEHIEPELLDNVLKDLRKLAAKAVFVVIATRPSSKTLADGRNAHLIVESPEWWRDKLESLFFIASWTADSGRGEVEAVLAPFYRIDQVIAKSAVSDTIRYEQSVVNCGKVAERLEVRDRHDERCIIACYGPSLHETWPTIIAERRAFGAKLVSVSGAHDFLIERGIVPDIHMDCDPREHKGWFTRNPHPDVNYWMASCVHPSVVERLKDYRLSLWHVLNGDKDMEILETVDPDGFLVAGGGSIGCRAINVMFTQGFRTFSIHGMDCAFSDDGKQHAADHSGKVQTEWTVQCNGRWFRSSGALVSIAKSFFKNLGALETQAKARGEPCIPGRNERVEIFLHGDGLLQELARANRGEAIAQPVG
jgi:hypothetical protein